MVWSLGFALALAQPRPASPEQEKQIRSSLSPAVAKMGTSCAGALPELKTSDFLAVIGAYEGAAIPTVTIAGQDRETSLAEIKIGRGRNPVYLVLSPGEALIWLISGETDRVRQVVVLQSAHAAVAGVPAARVHFVDDPHCSLPYDLYEGRQYETDVPVLALFGRRANGIGGDYGLYRAVVEDSGVTFDRSRVRSGDDVLILANEPNELVFPHGLSAEPSTLEQQFKKLFPAGIVSLSPADVVANAPVEPYEILPMTAGAVQLEQRGAIVPATAADVRRWKTRAVVSGHVRADKIRGLEFYSPYRVTRPIRLPAGLCGGYSLTFFVASREYVSGDPCHSNIYVDDGSIMASPAASAHAND